MCLYMSLLRQIKSISFWGTEERWLFFAKIVTRIYGNLVFLFTVIYCTLLLPYVKTTLHIRKRHNIIPLEGNGMSVMRRQKTFLCNLITNKFPVPISEVHETWHTHTQRRYSCITKGIIYRHFSEDGSNRQANVYDTISTLCFVSNVTSFNRFRWQLHSNRDLIWRYLAKTTSR